MVSEFKEGRARVKKAEKYGFINKEGKLTIALDYDKCYDFVQGVAMVEQAGKKGLMDLEGLLLIPCQYDVIEEEKFHETTDRILRLEKAGKMAYYNATAKRIIWQEEGF